MNRTITIIARGLCEFFFLALVSLVPALFAFIDIVFLGDGVSELSLTEITQETLLFVSALLIGHSAWRHADSRGFLMLMAGFFACMLVRELDGLLDNIWHGFWFWPAFLLAIATITYVMIYCRDTILEPMANFIDSKAFFYIMFGLIVVLVFSRVFGSGAILWKSLMGPDYNPVLKSTLQEGLELFGYIFIAYGSYLFIRHKKINPKHQ